MTEQDAERQFEELASTMSREQIYNLAKRQAVEIANYASVVDETLQLAEGLNEGAAQGAGFVEHWGERVMQAVEPLRNVKSFPDKVLRHNRVLLEANSENVEKLTALRRELAEALNRTSPEMQMLRDQLKFSISKQNELQLDHRLACRLSRLFNEVCNLMNEDDYKINEFLKSLIKAAKKG